MGQTGDLAKMYHRHLLWKSIKWTTGPVPGKTWNKWISGVGRGGLHTVHGNREKKGGGWKAKFILVQNFWKSTRLFMTHIFRGVLQPCPVVRVRREGGVFGAESQGERMTVSFPEHVCSKPAFTRLPSKVNFWVLTSLPWQLRIYFKEKNVTLCHVFICFNSFRN